MELKRAIYRIQLLKNIKERDLILNVDEWTINRETLPLKSWSNIGKRAEFRSVWFEKSACLISAISSEGWHFSHLYTKTINSESFVKFLNDLSKFMRTNRLNKNRRTILLIDNATSHTAKVVLNVIESLFEIVFYLPQYSPQYAPVDNFFSSFKSKLIKKMKCKTYDLHTRIAKEELEKALKKIGSDEIKRMWQHCYKTLNKDNSEFFKRVNASFS